MRPRISAACAALAAALAALSAAAAEIAPHRALYVLSLTGPSSVVAAARGLVATEVRRDCDGWRYAQRYELETLPAGADAPERTSFTLAAEESLAGDAYAFRSETTYGEGDPITLVGRAELGPEGGVVRYTEPGAQTLKLPPGTGFPVSSVRDALAAAEAGRDRLTAPWFVGAAPNEPLLVSSVIIPAPTPADAEGLRAGPRWRFVSAYFEGGEDGPPIYEGEETLLANGVLAGGSYQYDGYALKLELQRLEPIPLPDC